MLNQAYAPVMLTMLKGLYSVQCNMIISRKFLSGANLLSIYYETS